MSLAIFSLLVVLLWEIHLMIQMLVIEISWYLYSLGNFIVQHGLNLHLYSDNFLQFTLLDTTTTMHL